MIPDPVVNNVVHSEVYLLGITEQLKRKAALSKELAPKKMLMDTFRPVGKVVQNSKNIKNAVICPRCKCQVSKKKMDKHFLKVHGMSYEYYMKLTPVAAPKMVKQQVKQKPTAASKKTPGVQVSNRAKIIGVCEHIFNADRQSKLDAMYGHHTIRDHGRFGSCPSYDRFDDESGA